MIEFKKQRELGEIISDTFAFLRQEFKPFMKAIFTIVGPIMVVFVIAYVIYMYLVGDIFSLGTSSATTSIGLILVALLLFFVTMVLAYVFANSTALHYIKSYIENNGEVNMQEVKHNVKTTFWPFVGLGILKWLVLAVSIVMCILPVFYFMVPMAMVFSILVFEKRDVSDSFGYSFTLIKDEFWITLASIIIIGLIVMVASWAFSLPASLYSLIKMGVFSGEVDPASMEGFIDPIDILLNTIATLIQFLLNLVSIVAYAFIYFNLNERKNFTGTYEKIEALGQSE